MRIKLVKRFANLTRGGGAHILLKTVESLLRVKQASNYGADDRGNLVLAKVLHRGMFQKPFYWECPYLHIAEKKKGEQEN